MTLSPGFHHPSSQLFPTLDMHKVLSTAAALTPNAASCDSASILLIEWSDTEGLIAAAQALAGSRLVAIQSNAAICERCLALAKDCGVTNLRVLHASVDDLADDFGVFDYIITDGFYSITSEDTRQSLWRVSKGSLSPSGLLFLSYSVLPGAGHNFLLRDFTQLAGRGISNPSRRLEHIWEAVQMLGRHQDSGHPLAREAARILTIGRDAALGGELHPGLCAFRFGEIVDAAAKVNLRYVGELLAVNLETQPGAIQLARLFEEWAENDPVTSGELLDILTLNSHRHSFFTPSEK